MRKSHQLKIHLRYFNLLITGRKTFEIRRNDREFKEGDIVFLTEIDPAYKDEGESLTGRYACYEIGHVSDFEQKEGFVVFGVLGLKLLADNAALAAAKGEENV